MGCTSPWIHSCCLGRHDPRTGRRAGWGAGLRFPLAPRSGIPAHPWAVGIQVVTQARINTLAKTFLQQWDGACEWERRVLNGPRHVQPLGFKSAPLFEGRDVWSCPIPLVLVATGYVPYSAVEPVEGPEKTVWWIDPSTDEAFLDSLAEPPLAAIRLWRVVDAPPTRN